jgi:uncharacterized membrane protein YhaH (DUF805 family)
MNFQAAVKRCLTQKYIAFDGRARRSEFWWFFLFQLIVLIVAGAIHKAVYGVAVLALLLPGIGVGMRRLHDTGKSGWWLLLGLIPIVNLVLLYFFAQPGSESANEYGDAPKVEAESP